MGELACIYGLREKPAIVTEDRFMHMLFLFSKGEPGGGTTEPNLGGRVAP